MGLLKNKLKVQTIRTIKHLSKYNNSKLIAKVLNFKLETIEAVIKYYSQYLSKAVK